MTDNNPVFLFVCSERCKVGGRTTRNESLSGDEKDKNYEA